MKASDLFAVLVTIVLAPHFPMQVALVVGGIWFVVAFLARWAEWRAGR